MRRILKHWYDPLMEDLTSFAETSCPISLFSKGTYSPTCWIQEPTLRRNKEEKRETLDRSHSWRELQIKLILESCTV